VIFDKVKKNTKHLFFIKIKVLEKRSNFVANFRFTFFLCV